MINKKYKKSLTIALAIFCFLFFSQIYVHAQGTQKKTLPAVPLLLLSETPPPPKPNIAFITSDTHDGNLGGLAGADQQCQALATAAGLPQNTYKAWLSTSSANAIDRLGTARGWVRVDGKPFADTKADIVAGEIFHPLRVDENGVFVSVTSNLYVWTGTNADGEVTSSGRTCENWTTSNGAVGGDEGSYDGVGATFTLSAWSDCSAPLHFYCFGVDNNVPVTVRPVTGRIAFVTRSLWTPSGGLAAADSLCQTEASSASLPGIFKALLATSTGSAGSRFPTITPGGLPWVRPDGVAIAPTAAELFTSTFLNTAINQTADGLTYYGYEGMWGGAWDLTTAGTMETTCNNWTNTLGDSRMGFAGFTYQTNLFAKLAVPCAVERRLYCLQE